MLTTKNKKAETRLRTNEEQLKLIFNTISDIIFLISIEKGRYKFNSVNQAFLTATGLKEDQVIGKYVDQVIPEPSLSMVLEKYDTAIQTCQAVQWEETSEYPAGTKTGIVTITPASSGQGEFTQLVGVVHDITERKKIELELQEAEVKFRSLVVQALIGVYILQGDKFAYVNPYFAKIFGYDQKELVDSFPVESVIYKDDRPLVEKNINARLAGDKSKIHYEVRGLAKDKEILLDIVCGGLISYKGEPAIIGTVDDITDRKRVEVEREQALYLLNERVKELSTLYSCSQIFQKEERSTGEVLQEIVNILPAGWQYPEITAARIVLGETKFNTPNFANGPHKQTASFDAPEGKKGVIEIVYLEQKPIAQEDAFLTEERNLINMVAETVKIYLSRRYEDRAKKRLAQEISDQKIQQQKKITRAIINAEEKERNKIGQELHDNVNQILASVKLFLRMAKGKDIPSKPGLIDDSLKLVDNAIEEIRLLTESQVTPLKKFNLKELIQLLITKLKSSTSLRTRFVYDVNSPIDNDLKLNIYRIVQEQVNNIVKHAHATTIGIKIVEDKSFLHLFISDDGKGFDPHKKKKGIGILNMINRIESFNGELKIESSTGNGFKLIIKIPLQPE